MENLVSQTYIKYGIDRYSTKPLENFDSKQKNIYEIHQVTQPWTGKAGNVSFWSGKKLYVS